MATEDTATVTQEDVYEALEEVIDPELGLDFVSLGLVYDVEIEDSAVYVTFTLTYPGCPIGPQVSEQIKEFVGELQGVDGVHPKMVFDPPWTPDMMSEDAKFALGYLGHHSGVRQGPGSVPYRSRTPRRTHGGVGDPADLRQPRMTDRMRDAPHPGLGRIRAGPRGL